VRANISAVRVQNCFSEPCLLRKGVHVPVEIDFEFAFPVETSIVVFGVFLNTSSAGASAGSSGRGDFGPVIASESDCLKLQLADCPAKALTKYTLKHNIYIDPELKEAKHSRISVILPIFLQIYFETFDLVKCM
jgi:hypothetical protein